MLKAVSSITNAIGALNYKGTWNASTNTPTLASGAGTKGDYYVVSVAGTTSLDGISNWGVGDWAVFNGSVWQRVEGGADLNGVNLSVTGNSDLGNVRVAGNTISSTNANGNIALTPNGTGEVDITKVDIDGGAIDGTTIGAASRAAGSFSSLTSGARVIVDAASSAGITDISYGSLSGGAFVNTPAGTIGYLAVGGNAALSYAANQVASITGSVSAPALSTFSDTNTGLYYPGADQIALSAGGVARVYGSTTGVGISTVTPNAPLSMASSFRQDGSPGSSFDVYIPITSIMFKQADASTLANAGSNGNAELTLAAGTDIVLGSVGGVGNTYVNSNDSRLTSSTVIAPTGYVVAARVVVVGDANQVGDQDQVYVLARSSVDNGTTWFNFDLATGYRHQFYNARWLMLGKWMPISTDFNATHGSICQFGVRAASTVGLIYTNISVQIAYVKI